jgi:hypothetical protein
MLRVRVQEPALNADHLRQLRATLDKKIVVVYTID